MNYQKDSISVKIEKRKGFDIEIYKTHISEYKAALSLSEEAKD